MNHLTVDEVTSFVSADKLDTDTVNFLTEVNCHLRECAQCRKTVNAFLAVSDGLKGSDSVATGLVSSRNEMSQAENAVKLSESGIQTLL